MCKEEDMLIDNKIIELMLDMISDSKPCKSENGTIFLDRNNESDRDWYEDK